MRQLIIFSFLVLGLCSRGQQTIIYTQYTFNKAGMNPAASGTDMRQEYYYAFGMGRQWIAFDNAPKTHFVNFSYTIRPPRSYSFWQNAGIYVDNEDTGLLGSTGAYLTYTFHKLIMKKLVAAFGVQAGMRRFERSTGNFDINDPAVQKSRSAVLVYPDIIPGFRLSSSKFFMDISAKYVTINRQQDFKKRRIGSPSILYPTLYFDYGWKRTLSERLLMMPSFALNVPLPGVPIAEFNLMFYFGNRLGLGASVRNLGFVSGILQIRFLESLTAGFAYSYPVNHTRYASPTSYEIMIGVVPYGMDTKLTGKHSVARCPSLSY